jgi:DNA-binding NtrC family response regulator
MPRSPFPSPSSSESLAAKPAAAEEAAAALDGARLVDLPYKTAVKMACDRVTREYLAALMTKFAGSVTQAAEMAGIERESLHRLLKKYGLRSEAFRQADQSTK